MSGDEASAIELLALQSAWRTLALRWELTWQERTALLPDGDEYAVQPPENTERRMRLLVEIGHRLRCEDDLTLCDWLREPSKYLKYHSPLDVMSAGIGDLRAFRRLVEAGVGS